MLSAVPIVDYEQMVILGMIGFLPILRFTMFNLLPEEREKSVRWGGLSSVPTLRVPTRDQTNPFTAPVSVARALCFAHRTLTCVAKLTNPVLSGWGIALITLTVAVQVVRQQRA